MNTSVLVFNEYGNPSEVLKVENWNLPHLGPNDVLVEMRSAPINPADLNTIEGRYMIRPPLPAVAGSEGVGVVREVGANVKSVEVGDRVLAPRIRGSWCRMRVVGEQEVIALRTDISDAHAAMLTVNPATALRMLLDFMRPTRGKWLIQNAANSGVGRCVIQLARHYGFKTINIVRRKELIDELKELGADVVVLQDEFDPRSVEELTGGKGVRCGFNAVGGESAKLMARALSERSTLVTYGAMSKQPMTIENRLLIFKDIQFCGFSVRSWYMRRPMAEITKMIQLLESLSAQGILSCPVEAIYPLSRVSEAIEHALCESRSGKILFQMDLE